MLADPTFNQLIGETKKQSVYTFQEGFISLSKDVWSHTEVGKKSLFS